MQTPIELVNMQYFIQSVKVLLAIYQTTSATSLINKLHHNQQHLIDPTAY